MTRKVFSTLWLSVVAVAWVTLVVQGLVSIGWNFFWVLIIVGLIAWITERALNTLIE